MLETTWILVKLMIGILALTGIIVGVLHGIISFSDRRTRRSELLNSELIFPHYHKPNPVFYGEEAEEFYGVELEYRLRIGRCRSNWIRQLTKFDRIYLKEDGSVDLEVVSHPMTILEHCKYDWSTILSTIGKRMKVDSGCGLHIHCDPQSSKVKVGIGLIVYNNQRYLEQFGRRKWTRYCKSKPLKDIDPNTGMGILNATDRYEAVNFTGRTVEFRFFMSTLYASQLEECIRLCERIINAAKGMSLEECAAYRLDEPELLDYVL